MTWAPFGARVYWAERETPRPFGKGAGPAKRRGLIHKEGKLGERGKRQRDERSFTNNREREERERERVRGCVLAREPVASHCVLGMLRWSRPILRPLSLLPNLHALFFDGRSFDHWAKLAREN